jgi:hypothetical protein
MPELVRGPFLIDTGGYSKWANTTGYPGPFCYGQKVYLMWWVMSLPPPFMARSLNNGLTWAPYDHPDFPDVEQFKPRDKPGTSRFRVCYTDSLGNVSLFDYDMASDSVIADGTTGPVITGLDYCYNPVLDRDEIFHRVSYQDIYWIRHTPGGSYAAQVLISDGNPSYTWSMGGASADPATGDIHVVMERSNSGWPPEPYSLYHRIIFADGSLSALTLIHSDSERRHLNTMPVVAGADVLIATSKTVGTGASSYRIGTLWVGTPAAAPVFTEHELGTQRLYEIQPEREPPAGDARIFWIEFQTLDGLTGLDRLVWAAWDGDALSAPEVIHDEEAYESFPGTAQYLHDLAPPFLAPDGLRHFTMALEYTPPGYSSAFCTGFYWMVPWVEILRRGRICYRKPFFPPR